MAATTDPLQKPFEASLMPRAHIGLAFHSGGERHLANVYRLCDLARNFETSRPGSFRSFVEFLETEHESGEQAEAAVLEQQAGGVQLMTVHKAKGLEFPVVILADMTTPVTQQSGCDRYVDSSRRLCAQKLCSWAPWELQDHEDAEAAEDRYANGSTSRLRGGSGYAWPTER